MKIGTDIKLVDSEVGISSGISLNDRGIKIPMAICRYGGKHRLFKRYQKVITEVAMRNNLDMFIDCFGGGGSISFLASQMRVPGTNQALFNKIIYNEKEPGVAVLFKVLSSEEQTKELVGRLLHTPYNKEVFLEAKAVCDAANSGQEFDDLELAYYSFLCTNLSFSSIGRCYRDYLSYTYNGKFIDYEQLLYKHAQGLYEVVPYMKRIEVRCGDYSDVLAENQFNSRALLFLDPPYLAAERAEGSDKAYRNEMWNVEHIFMTRLLANCWNWILCGYREKAQGASKLIYDFIEDQPGVELIDLGLTSKPISKKSMYENGSHEMVWVRSLN